MEEPVRFHATTVPAPEQTAPEQKMGEAAISIEMTREVGDDVEGSPKKKYHFDHHHHPSTSSRHTTHDTFETFNDKYDKYEKYDKYAFHTNTSLRQGEVPSVSTTSWNTPLHPIQTGTLPSTRSTWLPYCLQWPMFGYPFQINEVNARIVGIQVTALAAMVIAERDYRWSYYVTVLLFTDYTMRFLFGARASILGVTAEMIAYFLPRKFVPGPPKQFAALCAMLFTGLSSILFFRLNQTDTSAENLGPAIIMGVLMGCAALEGFANFCVGCFCFNIGLKLGIFPQHAVTRPELVYDETDSTSQEMDYNIDRENPPTINIWIPDGEHKVPLIYKSSTDAQKRAKFNLIKHMSGAYFMIPMGIAGLAIVWEISAENHYENFAIQGKSVHHPSLPTLVWKILALVSGIIWSLMILLWTAKLIFYPHKIYREWDHPQKRHLLCAAPITMLLFVYLCEAQLQDKLAEVLFWIAGPIQLTLSTLIMVYWIRELHHRDSFTPVWMFGPLGNIVAAIVLPRVSNGEYIEAAWLWFSMGVFFWVILTTQSMSRLTWYAPLLDEIRPSVFMLMAAPSVVMIAWISLNGGVLDGFARFTYFIGVGFSFVLAFLILTSYFGRNKFDINWWGYAFPLDTIAIASILYNFYMPNELTESICTTYIAVATWMHALLTCHFVLGLITRNNGVFLPEPKDSPLAFMRMFHYAIRFSMNKMNQLSHQFAHEDKVIEFCQEFIKFRVALENHMKHEENVYFPAWRSQWPGMSEMFDTEHDHDAQLVSTMHQLVDRIMHTPVNDVNRPALLEQITRQFESISKSTIDHIDHEEKHLQWFNHKYLPLHAQYRLARDMWESTSSKDWAVITPWIIQNQYVHQRRIKFLAAIRWAMPDVIQQVGHWLYEGLDELTFERLLIDIPEIAPRHTWGYYRVW